MSFGAEIQPFIPKQNIGFTSDMQKSAAKSDSELLREVETTDLIKVLSTLGSYQ